MDCRVEASLSFGASSQKLQQPVGEFPSPFAYVPWGHHIAIISKCKSVDEALFYIGKTIEQGMSRAAREFAAQT